MKKRTNLKWIIVPAVILVLAIGAFLYFSNNFSLNQSANSNMNPNASANSQNTSPHTNLIPASSSQPIHNIAISSDAFSPSSIAINVGDTIIWTNQDNVSHTVTSDSGSELNSSSLSPGQIYYHTFAAPGTFNYHCSVYPNLKGTVVVQ